MDDPRKLPQEEIPKRVENKESEETEKIKENLEDSNNSENARVEDGLEQGPPAQEKPVEVEKVEQYQSPEKKQPEEILEEQAEVNGELTQEKSGKQKTISQSDKKDVEINNLVKLALRGEKEEKEATAEARKLFEKDPHSLDDFHDQLIEEKQERNKKGQ